MPPQIARLVARQASGICLALSLVYAPLGCTAIPHAAAPRRDHWTPSYVFGIWGKAELDVRDDCPTGGAATIRIGATWSTLLVSVITLGLYTPSEVVVRCRVQP